MSPVDAAREPPPDYGEEYEQVMADLDEVDARLARIADGGRGFEAAQRRATGEQVVAEVDGDVVPAPEQPVRVLPIMSLSDVVAAVDAMPAPTWLARPVWPADAYGVIAAEDKAGKTWSVLDLAVSAATGTSWLGVYPCDTPGPVLVFLGEGGQRKMVRRLRAVAAGKGVDLAELAASGRLRVCFRVPHLKGLAHIAAIAQELEEHPAALTIIDPLYLAARGAKGNDLYEMGEHLENVQVIAQDAGSALAVVTHFNKTGEGRGSKRISGVGPGAWGRVLATAHVESRNTDDNGRTTVVLGWQFRGDEIPDTDLHVTRQVWADDQDDLTSPMHYTVTVSEAPPEPDAGQPKLSPAAQRVLSILQTTTADTVPTIGDRLADQGRPLQKRTIQDALSKLRDAQLAHETPTGPGGAYAWNTTTPREDTESAPDLHA